MKIKNGLKNARGITLIALVITIIVLLILAGVSINLVLGPNGLITKAQEAAIKTEQAKEDELRQLTILEATTNLKNTTYFDSKGNKATVPAGFAVSKVEGENEIDTGLVIIDFQGNEFVWIPINQDLTVLGTDKLIAKKINETNYVGIIYNWIDDPTGKTTYEYDWTENASVNFANERFLREPAILNDVSFSDENEYNLSGITQESLQEDYNTMIQSIIKNGGFYVSRYEMSLDDNGNAISQKGKIPASAAKSNSTTTIGCNTWYGLYDKARTYSNSYVNSSMIWGSQYDAILQFTLTNEEDSSKVNSKSNARHDYSQPQKTGNDENDKMINIYDLEGNLAEWTLEASYAGYRSSRGCHFHYANPPSNRYGLTPTEADSDFGTRFTLYLN